MGKQVNERKRYLLMDSTGLVLAIVVTTAASLVPAEVRLLPPLERRLREAPYDLGR